MAPGVEVPSLDKIFFDGMEHKMLLTVPGRGPVCFRCQKVGHTRVNCKEVYYRHCQIYGQHITEECPSPASYANRAKAEAPRTEETSDFPTGDNEHATTSSAGDQDTMDQTTQDPEEAAGATTGGDAGTSTRHDWTSPTSESESVMSDPEFTLASQTIYEMFKHNDPDAFQLSSDVGSMATDTASEKRSGSEGEQAKKKKKKKHRGQGKGTA